MPDHNQCSDLFTAIDHATRWVYVEHKTVREWLPLPRYLGRYTPRTPPDHAQDLPSTSASPQS